MIEHIIQFFAYSHLPAHLAEVSKPFSDLAEKIVNDLPRNPERTVALRKLLEAKDAAVRARVAQENSTPKPHPDAEWDTFANDWRVQGARGKAISPTGNRA